MCRSFKNSLYLFMNINVELCKETLWILNVHTPPLEQYSASEILPRVALQKTVSRNNLSFQTRSHSRASLVHWVSSGPPSLIIYAVDEEQQRSPTMCQYHDECFNRVKIYFLPFVSIEREKESKKVYFPLVSLPWHRTNLLLLFSRWEKCWLDMRNLFNIQRALCGGVEKTEHWTGKWQVWKWVTKWFALEIERFSARSFEFYAENRRAAAENLNIQLLSIR